MSRIKNVRGLRSPGRKGARRVDASPRQQDGPGPFEPDARSLALCAQAHRALEYAIAGECRDRVLRELVLMDVVPEMTDRRLRVWLLIPADAETQDRDDIARRLTGARGFFRAAVAEAIHRKRTPELCFELVHDVDEDAEEVRSDAQ